MSGRWLLAGLLAATVALPAAATPAGHRLGIAVVAVGLRQPVHVAAAPGEAGRLYVVERAGRVRVIEEGRLLPGAFLDIRSRVRSGGLLGLLSIAFPPRYATNRRMYAMYTGRGGDVFVVELRVQGGRAQLARTLLRVRTSSNPYAHVGGQLAFGPGGGLLVGVGDGLTPAAAQDLASPLGKILRVDVDHPAKAPKVVALGFRNPWRFSFDRRTGDLYVGDVGASAWEEIDVIRRGTRGAPNFGWDAYEGSSFRPGAEAAVPDGAMPPFVEYGHPRGGCAAVIGGFVYRGRDVASAQGRYFYGDTCSGAVWSVPASARRPPRPRREPFTVAQLSSFGEDTSGELYLVARGPGAIFRLVEASR
jgi:glucose/arabinose dehydrogenase